MSFKVFLQYFSKPGDTFLSGRRLVWPRLALPCHALWIIKINIIYSAWKKRLFPKFDASPPTGSFPLTVSRTSYSWLIWLTFWITWCHYNDNRDIGKAHITSNIENVGYLPNPCKNHLLEWNRMFLTTTRSTVVTIMRHNSKYDFFLLLIFFCLLTDLGLCSWYVHNKRMLWYTIVAFCEGDTSVMWWFSSHGDNICFEPDQAVELISKSDGLSRHPAHKTWL